MNKENKKKQKTKTVVSMPVVNAYAAGIDISDTEHVVALPEGVAEKRVYAFGTMTCDLYALADLLLQCEIDTVAMESTGVYWKPLFSVLVQKGLEVYLVNAAHVKNVTGRKDDENDALWLQKLHSCGLLKTSYLPDDEQEALRSIVRYRKTLVQDSSRFINRLQKVLELMNVKFHTIISDITGQTGCKVIEAIIAGERNAKNFLPLIDYRVKAKPELIVQSLEGTWRPEQLFLLKEAYEMYQHYRLRISGCDAEIEKHLQCLEARSNEGTISTQPATEMPPAPAIEKKKDKNQPKMNVRNYLQKIHGVDVLAIYGLGDIGGLELLAETGTDLSKWKNEKHFTSWLNVSPNNKISGGKLLSSRIRKNRQSTAGQALRTAANAVRNSHHWLGDYFRRIRSRGGEQYAIVATANKIAKIYYKMVRYKQEFKPVQTDEYKAKYRQKKIAYLERQLKNLKTETA